jgi:serine protease Do
MSIINRKSLTSAAALSGAAVLAFGAGYGWNAANAQAPLRNSAGVVPPGAPPTFADIVARVAPAVVSIDVEKRGSATRIGLESSEPMSPFQFFGAPGDNGQDMPFGFRWAVPGEPGGQSAPSAPAPERGSGSGFFISADGYIVTNNHVVDGADKITVRASDGREFKARVVGRDPATDLAVVKVDGGPFQYVSFENRARPRVGDWVVAVGNPFGLGGTATAGIVSALARPNVSGSGFVDYMQIDAPINRGNSGGPTFDVDGRVVGVNSAIISPSGGSVGIGFDIPADVAAAVTRQLIDSGKVTRGFIGATVQTLSPELSDSLGLTSTHGVVVDTLTPGGPSQRAGLRSGDVILSVNGRSVESASGLTQQVALARPGDDIHLGILRAGRRQEVDVRSGLRPTEAALASNDGGGPTAGDERASGLLGMELTPDPSGGLVVGAVSPNSDAAAKGLRQGDVILRAGSRQVQSTTDLSGAVAVARTEGRKSVPLLVARAGQQFYVPVEVAGGRG